MEAPPEPAIDESGVNRAAWMAKAGLEEDIVPAPAPAPVANVLAAAPEAAAPVNVLAAAPAAPAVDAERQRLSALLDNRNKAIRDEARERLKALNAATPRPFIVDGRLVSPTGQVIYEPPPGPVKPSERYVPVGQDVFDRVEGKFIEGPSRARGALAPAAGAREARTKAPPADVAAMQQLGYPLTPEGYAQFKAAGRKPAAAPAAAPGAPAVGTPAQQAVAARQRTAQANLSQDIRTQLGYYEKLAEMGAMTSPTRSVAENVAAFARSSGIGQQAERAIATEAQTLRDNIKNTRQRLFLQMKDATGATASQMNSNAEMQAWLNSMTDPQQSIETVRETLKQMDYVIAGMRDQVAREAAAKGGAGAAPAAAPAPAPAPARAPAAAAPRRREIAPGVFVTERP